MDGFLPMIKCSSCAVDIDISQLADHVCSSSAPSAQGSLSPKLDRAATFGGASFNNRSEGPSRSARMPPPPRIDPNAANKPFRPLDPSPINSYSNRKSRSPLLPGNGRSPYPMNRSATSPMPRVPAPPSPDLLGNSDSPFPFFPTKRSATPTSARAPPQEWSPPSFEQRYAQPNSMYAPLSPRTNGGESVVKRMDTIAPGPFDARTGDRRPNTSNGSRTPAQETQGHRRTNTQGSVRSNGIAANQRTSMASAASRGSIFSNGSTGLPSRPKLGMEPNGALPPPPPLPAKNEKTEGIDAFLERLQKETMEPSKISQDSRSKTFPLRQQTSDDVDISAKQAGPSGLARRPTDVDPSSNDPPLRRSSRGGSKAMIKTNDLPPPPVPNYARDFSADVLNTPSDSGFSEDSYASSGFRSLASSRSSPPTSEAGHSRQPSKIGRSDYSSDELMPRTTSPESFAEIKYPYQPGGRPEIDNYNRARAPKPLTNLPAATPYSDAAATPTDPAIQKGIWYGKQNDEPKPLRDPALNIAQSPPPVPETEPRQQMTRRPTAANKGKCRGCGELILGKSVKDSSGRLTGRYHKACFVCRTCRDPFPTAEFYVFNNSPYCEQHYHELNDSVCRSCNRGIEGQYLQTDQRLKFHPRCFTCSTCRIVLRDDYYEVGGRNFCERHAYAATNQQNNMLGVGGMKYRNPQKRRTRLMMMS